MHSRPPEDRAFFGRRKGHALRSHQAALFETLLPQLALDLDAPAPDDPRMLFATPVEDVWLEIGFGGAEHLIAEASAHPGIGFIGCEPFINGMAKALAAIEAHRLVNVRLYHGDALALLDWLAPASVGRIDMMYPDPWPKRRHWKRRFVQDDNVVRLSRAFRCATDWADYAAWTLLRLARAPAFAWTAERADDWRMPWPGFAGTRYEAKARREGRMPCYLTFRRT